MEQKQSETTDTTITLLTQIESHLRLLVRLQLGPTYDSLVSTPELKNLYRVTGKKPVAVLAKEFGMSTGKISMLWQKWEQAGLLTKNGLHYEQKV